MTTTVLDIVADPIPDCPGPEALRATLTDYAASLGLPYFSYLMMKDETGAETEDEGNFLTNYPAEWEERYTRKLFRFYDPVALKTRQSRLPFFWDNRGFLRPYRKDQRRVFHEAKAFAISAGYSIPIAGPRGDVGVFSLIASRQGDIDDAIGHAGGEIYLRAVQIHDMMVRRTDSGNDAGDDHGLSARETECLRWTADGKTSDQISKIVSISAATVNFHLKNAVGKLGAANRHHAAIIAIRNGII